MAPRSCRARVMCVITLTWVDTGLPPHTTIRSAFAISRGSGPTNRPVPAIQPASAEPVQIVFFWREYRMTWRNRLMPSRITRPMVPA